MNKLKILKNTLYLSVAIPFFTYEITIRNESGDEIEFDGLFSERRIKRIIKKLRRRWYEKYTRRMDGNYKKI